MHKQGSQGLPFPNMAANIQHPMNPDASNFIPTPGPAFASPNVPPTLRGPYPYFSPSMVNAPQVQLYLQPTHPQYAFSHPPFLPPPRQQVPIPRNMNVSYGSTTVPNVSNYTSLGYYSPDPAVTVTQPSRSIPEKKRSHAIPIINPLNNQEVKASDPPATAPSTAVLTQAPPKSSPIVISHPVESNLTQDVETNSLQETRSIGSIKPSVGKADLPNSVGDKDNKSATLSDSSEVPPSIPTADENTKESSEVEEHPHDDSAEGKSKKIIDSDHEPAEAEPNASELAPARDSSPLDAEPDSVVKAPVASKEEKLMSTDVDELPVKEIPNHVPDTTPRRDSPVLVNSEEVDNVSVKKTETSAPKPGSKSSSLGKLKYSYESDQWSPINPEGKKQYNRDFLLMLRNDELSQRRPLDLPDLEVVKEKSLGRMSGALDFSKPVFVKSTSSRSGMQKKMSRDSYDGRDRRGPMPTPTKIVEVRIEKVELHQAENAWKPAKREVVNSSDETDQLLKKARGILNKLCPQKFETLVKQFNELQIDSEEKLRCCIDLVFEKAVDEPGFSVAYAQMCDVMQKKQVTDGSSESNQLTFRKLLVTRCQKEFERDYMQDLDKEQYEKDKAEAGDDEAKLKAIEADWDEKEMRARHRSLGNIRFIGELYKLKMLTGKIMHECIRKLLDTNHEEALECLCRLLTTVGKDLETETNAKISNTPPEELKKTFFFPLSNYFDRITAIIEQKKTSSRVRFMLQDLVDLRKNQWKPRRDVAGPKTIDQIHEEAEREQTQIQLLNQVTSLPSRDRSGPHDSRKKSARGTAQPSDDGWTTMPQRGSQRLGADRIDPKKVSNFIQAQKINVETLVFGPGPGSRQWGAGSGSLRASKTKVEPVADTRNKFDILNSKDSGPASLDYPSAQQHSHNGGNDGRRFIAPGPSRSVSGLPSKNLDTDRRRTYEAVNARPQDDRHMEAAAGPAMSMGPSSYSRPVPETINEVDVVLRQSELLKGHREDREKVNSKAKTLLEDFLSNDNLKEACECVCADFHPTTMCWFVETFVERVLEHRKSGSRRTVGRFLCHLIEKHILLKIQFEKGLKECIAAAPDIVMDVPMVWDYLGEILAPVLLKGVIPVSFLAHCGLSVEEGHAKQLLAGVLKGLVASADIEKAAEVWKSDNVKLTDFVLESEADVFVSNNKLPFLLSSSSEMPPQAIHAELMRLLTHHPKDSDTIIDWIEKNVGNKKSEQWFIKILMTAVTKISVTGDPASASVKLNASVMQDRCNLLRHFIDGNRDNELAALYALQELMHKWQHPNMLLHKIFETLESNDTISHNAFLEWEKSTDPSHQEGKGVAVSSTVKFFRWLSEADE